MIPAEVLAQRLAFVAHIDLLVARDIIRAWGLLHPAERLSVELIPELVALVTDVATAYGELSATAAADFYDYLAELAGTRLPPAVPADPRPPAAQVKKMAIWATAPLRYAAPLVPLALQRLTGATQRLAQQPGRTTMLETARRDRVRFARVPQGAETCAFCLMLASRGAVYATEAAAGAFDQWHDSCVTGSTLVDGPSTEAALRRWYEGEVVVIRTTDGDELTITSNHPVLTRKGWVAAGELNVGQQVVKRARPERDEVLVPDKQERPTRIEDVWSALRVNGFVAVPVAAEDFHGDGAGSDGDVYIVGADRFLLHEGDAAALQPDSQVVDASARGAAIPDLLPASCSLAPCFVGDGFAAGRFVRGSYLGCSGFRGHPGGAGQASGAVAATLDVGLAEPALYDVTCNAVLLRQGQLGDPREVGSHQPWRRGLFDTGGAIGSGPRFDPPTLETEAERLRVYADLGRRLCKRLAGQIEFNTVVQLERVKFAGHVYNLQTTEGWYSANGLIVSNCDCAVIPVFKPDDLPAVNVQMQEEWENMKGRGLGSTLTAWRSHLRDVYDITH